MTRIRKTQYIFEFWPKICRTHPQSSSNMDLYDRRRCHPRELNFLNKLGYEHSDSAHYWYLKLNRSDRFRIDRIMRVLKISYRLEIFPFEASFKVEVG